jgi:hypothetical protein
MLLNLYNTLYYYINKSAKVPSKTLIKTCNTVLFLVAPTTVYITSTFIIDNYIYKYYIKPVNKTTVIIISSSLTLIIYSLYYIYNVSKKEPQFDDDWEIIHS